jgi:hypothetical protein
VTPGISTDSEIRTTAPTSVDLSQSGKATPVAALERLASSSGADQRINNETNVSQDVRAIHTLPRNAPHASVARDVLRALGPTRLSSNSSTIRVAGLKTWSGRVVTVDGDIFTAEISPIDHTGPTVFADFRTHLLSSQTDSGEAAIGDIFYLTVRMIRDRGRLVSSTSSLRLQRVGYWQQEELDAARESARNLLNEITAYAQERPE